MQALARRVHWRGVVSVRVVRGAAAEPGDEVDGAAIPAFHDITSKQAAPQLNLVVRPLGCRMASWHMAVVGLPTPGRIDAVDGAGSPCWLGAAGVPAARPPNQPLKLSCRHY